MLGSIWDCLVIPSPHDMPIGDVQQQIPSRAPSISAPSAEDRIELRSPNSSRDPAWFAAQPSMLSNAVTRRPPRGRWTYRSIAARPRQPCRE